MLFAVFPQTPRGSMKVQYASTIETTSGASMSLTDPTPPEFVVKFGPFFGNTMDEAKAEAKKTKTFSNGSPEWYVIENATRLEYDKNPEGKITRVTGFTSLPTITVRNETEEKTQLDYLERVIGKVSTTSFEYCIVGVPVPTDKMAQACGFEDATPFDQPRLQAVKTVVGTQEFNVTLNESGDTFVLKGGAGNNNITTIPGKTIRLHNNTGHTIRISNHTPYTEYTSGVTRTETASGSTIEIVIDDSTPKVLRYDSLDESGNITVSGGVLRVLDDVVNVHYTNVLSRMALKKHESKDNMGNIQISGPFIHIDGDGGIGLHHPVEYLSREKLMFYRIPGDAIYIEWDNGNAVGVKSKVQISLEALGDYYASQLTGTLEDKVNSMKDKLNAIKLRSPAAAGGLLSRMIARKKLGTTESDNILMGGKILQKMFPGTGTLFTEEDDVPTSFFAETERDGGTFNIDNNGDWTYTSNSNFSVDDYVPVIATFDRDAIGADGQPVKKPDGYTNMKAQNYFTVHVNGTSSGRLNITKFLTPVADPVSGIFEKHNLGVFLNETFARFGLGSTEHLIGAPFYEILTFSQKVDYGSGFTLDHTLPPFHSGGGSLEDKLNDVKTAHDTTVADVDESSKTDSAYNNSSWQWANNWIFDTDWFRGLSVACNWLAGIILAIDASTFRMKDFIIAIQSGDWDTIGEILVMWAVVAAWSFAGMPPAGPICIGAILLLKIINKYLLDDWVVGDWIFNKIYNSFWWGEQLNKLLDWSFGALNDWVLENREFFMSVGLSLQNFLENIGLEDWLSQFNTFSNHVQFTLTPDGKVESIVRPNILTAGVEASFATTYDPKTMETTLYGWGDSGEGKLRGPLAGNINAPRIIAMPSTKLKVVKIASGRGHTVVVVDDGSLYSCGVNFTGQLGTGAGLNQSSQTSLEKIDMGSNGVASVICNLGYHGNSNTPLKYGQTTSCSFVVTRNGDLFGFGSNSKGQLGLPVTVVLNPNDANTPDTPDGYAYRKPTKIPLPGNLTVIKLSSGGNFTLALLSDGKVYAWGNNENGRLGTLNADSTGATSDADGNLISPAAPATYDNHYTGASNAKTIDFGSYTPVDLRCGEKFAIVVVKDAEDKKYIVGFGRGEDGVLGDGDATDKGAPFVKNDASSSLRGLIQLNGSDMQVHSTANQ